MDDDLTWDSSVWATADPVVAPAPSKPKPPPPNIEIPPPPQLFDDDAGFGDFDDFAAPEDVAQEEMKDDDFGDFEDFGEGVVEPVSSFHDDLDSFQPVAGPSSQRDWRPLEVAPSASRHELKDQIDEILGPIWEGENILRVTTDDPIREVEGAGQILTTRSSREMYQILLKANPPTNPTNWTRSRIRRQHLISLGIPVNLDEVLPKAPGKPLPVLEVHTRPKSTPPGRLSSSRSGTPQPGGPKNGIVAQFGPKPDIDIGRISRMLDSDPEWLKVQPLINLERQLAELKQQTANVSALLTYLMQSRDALQQDSETYNGLIAELVSEVAQKVKSGKPGLTRTMSARR
ncbi:hypothetical protein FA15DRAFT_664973 [Coprinopsis marcescibilis]|uniref:Uncharacterized protein n=1 Tax=Coprinopsis marcescibilis TaxID=230819 RepID=A0A5C3L7A7_COPMA|nr:hypothetical protein FA15DRAFT_664973 [Coprinopsis marcescibilis]